MANTGTAKTVIDGIEIELKHTSTKTLRIRVARDGAVTVTVPSYVTFQAAEELVRANIAWIKEQLANRTDAAAEKQPLSSATQTRIWGKIIPFTVIREEDRKRTHTAQTDDGIVIRAPEDITEDALQTALGKILNAELEARTQKLAPTLEARIGKHAAAYRFRRMTSRWGSCNTKTASITLNTVLAELDPVYLEYVMCHELCHLWEANHGSDFYAHLEAACPEWRRLRAELNAVTP